MTTTESRGTSSSKEPTGPILDIIWRIKAQSSLNPGQEIKWEL